MLFAKTNGRPASLASRQTRLLALQDTSGWHREDRFAIVQESATAPANQIGQVCSGKIAALFGTNF